MTVLWSPRCAPSGQCADRCRTSQPCSGGAGVGSHPRRLSTCGSPAGSRASTRRDFGHALEADAAPREAGGGQVDDDYRAVRWALIEQFVDLTIRRLAHRARGVSELDPPRCVVTLGVVPASAGSSDDPARRCSAAPARPSARNTRSGQRIAIPAHAAVENNPSDVEDSTRRWENDTNALRAALARP
jgi:hypothetical protein